MNKFALITLVSSALFLAACEDPAANKPKAQTGAPSTAAPTAGQSNNSAPPANAASTPAIKGTALPFSQETSKVEFTGSKVTGKHDGGFKSFKGTIDLVNNKPEESAVTVEIDAASIFTEDEKLTGHLKSADFFDVANFPTATFVSTKIVSDAVKGTGNYSVTGDFTLHGQKKAITFPAKITVGDAEVSVESEFSVNRKDFGIMYAGKADDLIRDDVVIRLNLKAPRRK